MSERSLDGCLKLADCLSASLLLPYRSSQTPQKGNVVAWEWNLTPVSQSHYSGVNLQRMYLHVDWASNRQEVAVDRCGRCGLWCDVVLVLGSWWFSRDWMMSAASGRGEWWFMCHKGSPGLSRTSLYWLDWLKPRQTLATGEGSVRDTVRCSCKALIQGYFASVAFTFYLASTSQQECRGLAIRGIMWQGKGNTHVIVSHTKTEKLHNYETEVLVLGE